MRLFIRILKGLLKLALLPLILLASFEFGLRYIFHDLLLNEFQSQIEDQLQGEISFSDIDITTITNFPLATVAIDSMSLKDANHELLQVNHLSVKLDLNKLYQETFPVEEVDLSGVVLYLPIDSTGQLLTIESTKKESPKPSGYPEIEIPLINISDLSVVIENKFDSSKIEMTLDSGIFEQHSTHDYFQLEGGAFMTVDTRTSSFNMDQHNPRLQLLAMLKNAEPEDSIQSPYITINFGIEEVISSSVTTNKIDSVKLKGYYSNGVNRNASSSRAVIEYGKFNYNQSYFDFSGQYINFNNPFIVLDLKSDIHLTDLKELLDLDEIEMTGDISLETNIKGDLETLDQGLKSADEISDASFVLNDVNYIDRNSDLAIKHLNGKASLKEAYLNIQHINGMYNQTSFSSKGTLDNILPLLGYSKGRNTIANLNIYAKDLVIPKTEPETESKPNSINQSFLPKYLELNIDFASNRIIYDSLSVSNVDISLFASKDSINVSNASCNFEDGKVTLNASSQIIDNEIVNKVDVTADLPYIDVNKYLTLQNDSSESKTSSSTNNHLELVSDIKVGKLKYNNIELDKLHLKGQLDDTLFHASVLGFEFPFGRIQSSLSVDLSDSIYVVKGASTARLKRFNIDSIKAYYNQMDFGKKEPKDNSASTDNSLLIEKYTLNFSTPEATYEDYSLQSLSSTLTIRDNDLRIHRAKFDLLDGTFKLNGDINYDEQKHMHLVCNVNAKELSLSEVISKFGTDDQELFGKEHFKGEMDLDGIIVLDYDERLDHQEENMIGNFDISLRDGQVINYAPISESMKFIKQENLEIVYLANPSFKVLFQNEELVIPTTIFKTSLANIELSGYHTGAIDYRYDLMISIKDLLLKSQEKKLKEVKSDSATFGRLKHYLAVETTNDSMEVFSIKKKHYEQRLSLLQERESQVDSTLNLRKASL
ncbi:AsmA-like C-terminal region-containing protein [Reichenbachiella versicolor]|uniref:AsmA-like C-terminal region-containing protein n=1 Tax=Reichenbachiella versicolor TaxID=1821036 RepID=UPI0013A53E81|nr:AsmA-like C-terminal region-containing protein [Reichenbachiella versicolor]